MKISSLHSYKISYCINLLKFMKTVKDVTN